MRACARSRRVRWRGHVVSAIARAPEPRIRQGQSPQDGCGGQCQVIDDDQSRRCDSGEMPLRLRPRLPTRRVRGGPRSRRSSDELVWVTACVCGAPAAPGLAAARPVPGRGSCGALSRSIDSRRARASASRAPPVLFVGGDHSAIAPRPSSVPPCMRNGPRKRGAPNPSSGRSSTAATSAGMCAGVGGLDGEVRGPRGGALRLFRGPLWHTS